MKKRNYIILILTTLCCFEVDPMMRSAKFGSVQAAKYFDHAMICRSISVEDSIALVTLGAAVGIGITIPDKTACALAIAAPMFISDHALQANKDHKFAIVEFRNMLKDHAYNALNKVCWEPDNVSIMKDLLRAQWMLHQFESREHEIETAIQVSSMSRAAVPLSIAAFYCTQSLEVFIAGMSVSYLLAGALAAQKKLQEHTLYNDHVHYIRLDSHSMDVQFVEKNYAMVARVQDQFKPVFANYRKRMNELSLPPTKLRQKFSESVDKQLKDFSVIMKKELEDFKV